MADVFREYESNVRSYCRAFPGRFSKASGSWLVTESGARYLDLLCAAGSLNYGHNHSAIIDPVVDYLQGGNIVQSLDLHTSAKAVFLDAFQRLILTPRGMTYKCQFTGPTGTNAVEAALKLARKVTGRSGVAAFTNAFHGMTLGALAATANPDKRAAAGLPLSHVSFLPYDGYLGSVVDTMDVIEAMLERPGSGLDQPAAILVEMVQGEGGLASARGPWIKRLASLARRIGALLIVDDIQAGCGRTGTFFSFEAFDFQPDIVVLSKSLSGFGTPMSVVLMRPDLDVWKPGEHNGTFRGNNLGFVGATAAILEFWSNDVFAQLVRRRADQAYQALAEICAELPSGFARIRGRGLMVGLEFAELEVAASASARLFERAIIIETCGTHDHILKLMPALTITEDDLAFALREIRAVLLDLANCTLYKSLVQHDWDTDQSFQLPAPLLIDLARSPRPVGAERHRSL